MATTDTTLTLARPTVTTDLTGSRAACSSVPGLGMAGAEVGVVGAVVGAAATTDEEATAGVVVVAITEAQDMVGEATADGVTLAEATPDKVTLDEVMPDAATRVVGFEVTRSTVAAVASTVAVVVGSTVVAADFTVAAVATAAAGIDNLL
ncbi:MAG: hypothetical protein WAL52_20215 [Candidatus Sulfotelmatobacter sp.]